MEIAIGAFVVKSNVCLTGLGSQDGLLADEPYRFRCAVGLETAGVGFGTLLLGRTHLFPFLFAQELLYYAEELHGFRRARRRSGVVLIRIGANNEVP